MEEQNLSKLHVSRNPDEAELYIRFRLKEIQMVEDILIDDDIGEYVTDIFREPDPNDPEYMGYIITFNDSFGLYLFGYSKALYELDAEKAAKDDAKKDGARDEPDDDDEG